jgi:lipopolysaccharide/colanic/teichoic acid biosynthesis glycosyltransferase
MTPRLPRHGHTFSLILKRVMDLWLASMALLLTAPIVLLSVALICLESRGNPFFVQTRTGHLGKEFSILKLRTMRIECFGIFPDTELHANDPRITRVGKLLRRTKADELPQLVNIILGHMSLVGPRPDIPEQVQRYARVQYERLAAKPGLTGVAQISGNIFLSWNDRIKLDLWYIDNRSMLLDIKILFLTMASIMKGESRHSDPLDVHHLINEA